MVITDYIADTDLFPADLESHFLEKGFVYFDCCNPNAKPGYTPKEVNLSNKTFTGFGLTGNVISRSQEGQGGLTMRVFTPGATLGGASQYFDELLDSLKRANVDFQPL